MTFFWSTGELLGRPRAPHVDPGAAGNCSTSVTFDEENFSALTQRRRTYVEVESVYVSF